MIIKNVTYKGNSFDSIHNIVFRDNNKGVNLRTDIINKQNFHGSRSTNTLAEGRLFTFTGLIYGATYQERQIGIDFLNGIIKPEGLPTETNRGFYQLTWEDWNGNKFKTQAKVFSMCDFKHIPNEPIIEFTFELYSEQAWYYGFEDLIYTGVDTGNIVGIQLETIFEFSLSQISNTIQITNSGDFVAPCSIRLQGTLENPVIYNNTTQTAYRLDGVTTTDLIIDNRGEILIVTDKGLNISRYRGSGSSSIFLNPGINEIFIFGDNVDPSITVTIEYNHTYIGS
ncbi:MAG: phage tail family protein [Candidatus Gracilibacteria bacterium]|nr:phage tail family protein [Candidatus Gracilibacteria bacterium]